MARIAQELRNLREELAASEQLVREAKSLKAYVSNGEILKEKLHAEQQRAQRAEAALAAAGEAKADIAALDAQLAHWREFYKVAWRSAKDFQHLRRLDVVCFGAPCLIDSQLRDGPNIHTLRAACAGCGRGPEAGGPAPQAAAATAGQPRAERAPGAECRRS